jgi:hypothetical protein
MQDWITTRSQGKYLLPMFNDEPTHDSANFPSELVQVSKEGGSEF